MSNPKISVIIPVYNAAQFLDKCLDSILSQTFTDFELLLIDDGSKDSSGEICDRYAARDSRVRVFHKPNGGVSSARNLGLDNAQGEWIAFCDADDYVAENYLLELLNEAISSNADFVVQDFDFAKENGEKIDKWYIPFVRIYDKTDFGLFVEEQNFCSRGYSFCKLFQREIINNHKICYPINVHFGEDLCFCLSYITYASRISCSNIVNYHYIDHPGSAIHRKHNFAKEYAGWYCIKDATLKCIKNTNLSQNESVLMMNNILMYLHRAITVIETKNELQKITDDDWTLFIKYFKPVSRKTTLLKFRK